MNSLNKLSGKGNKRYLFPSGTVVEVSPDHRVEFYRGGNVIDKEPWLYEAVEAALAYDGQGLVVRVSALPRYIREELGRISFVGARLWSALLGGF